MCSRATIASCTWNECQLIDIFNSLLAASICCHRGRHRCDTVIHACLQPTRGLSLKADLNFCVRPSVRGTPTTHSEGLLLRVAHYLVHLLITTVAWYSTWSSIVWGLHSHTNAARRPQRAMQTVLLYKRPPTASNNLYRGRNCCKLQRVHTDIFSGHDCVFLVQ